MKRLLGIAAVAAVLLLPFRAINAHASSVGDCQAQITALSAATSATTFSDSKQSAKTQTQLVHHLDQAAKSLSLGENKTAAQQIKEYLSDLNDAVASGRVTSDAAAPLATAANDVATCIASIQ